MAISTPTTAGQILTSAYVNNNINSGLVYIASKTWTSVSANQQLDNCFSSTYDNYRITFSGIGNQATPAIIGLQFVDGTTPDTGANSQNTQNVIVFPGPTDSLLYNGTETYLTTGFVGDYQCAFAADVYSPNKAENTNVVSECVSFGTGNFRIGKTGGMKQTTTQYEGLVLTRATGSWAGTITVFGYRKA